MSGRLYAVVPALLLSAIVAAEPLVEVAVVPLTNLTDYRGRMLERRAAAALAVEFSGNWVSQDPARVAAAYTELALPFPAGTGDLQRLCHHLAGTGPVPGLALTGSISEVRLQPSAAQVVLYVELLEPLSGEAVGRAWGRAALRFSQPSAADERLEAALRQAARQAVRELGAPALVGEVAEVTADGRVRIAVARESRVGARGVLLLLSPQGGDHSHPAAAVVVESVRGGLADCRVLGGRDELVAGLKAVSVGRIP